ncbi:hypothetical protein [Kordia jejudonensis]|uniref:hypothetical protein n=1 Tax=Kordia jejudonensis TaxID=1348245 RepID=UPI0012E0AAD1|nr:hypothetical protein [Kordia jejudonensis]
MQQHIQTGEFSRILVMSSWSDDIPEMTRNIIVADALNHCVESEELLVMGYLIKNQCVFLIGFSRSVSIEETLNNFFRQVAYEIEEYYQRKNNYNSYKVDNVKKIASYAYVFKQYPFTDDYIRKIIMGQTIKMPYYDPRLARLQDYLRYENFCSALDYAGGKSPVLVTIKQKY